MHHNDASVELPSFVALGAAEDVHVELDHARLICCLLILFFLMMYAFGNARHYWDPGDDAAVEDSQTEPSHLFFFLSRKLEVGLHLSEVVEC